MILGLILSRGTRLFVLLTVPFVLAVLLTLLQVATGSDTLALLFPWRVSAVLLPIATTVILSRLIAAAPRLDGPVARGIVAVVVGVCVAGGVWIMASPQAFLSAEDEQPLYDHVRQERRPGQLYLLPVRGPSRSRGSWSSDFQPLAHKNSNTGNIPIDLQRFRLATGVPIFVDFKSIPYKDTDVIEWRHRLEIAQSIQDAMKDGRLTEALTQLRHHHITHVVTRAAVRVKHPAFAEVHEDPAYRVYRLAPATQP
jgi:hypothetical protein